MAKLNILDHSSLDPGCGNRKAEDQEEENQEMTTFGSISTENCIGEQVTGILSTPCGVDTSILSSRASVPEQEANYELSQGLPHWA